VEVGVNVKYLEVVSTRMEEFPVLPPPLCGSRSKCEVPGGSKYQDGGVFQYSPPFVEVGVNVKYLEVISTRREEYPVLPSLWMQK
jgi:hypothetical protein